MEIGSPEWRELIRDGAAQLAVDLEPGALDRFTLHARELSMWNRRINLTAITDPREMALKHYVDSLAPAAEIPGGAYVLDIGTGGGFPGLPLKIAMPSIALTLIDSSRKKVSFLKHVVRRLGLTDVQVYNGRPEDLPRAEIYDLVISRALGELTDFVRMALPLVKDSGVILAMKGRQIETELQDVRQMVMTAMRRASVYRDVVVIEATPYDLPGMGAGRNLIRIRSTRPGGFEDLAFGG